MENRAKQFMSFDALKGFRKLLEEKEQLISTKTELSIDDYEELSNKIKEINKGDTIKIIYYLNKEYKKIDGIVSNINFTKKSIIIENQNIKFEDILSIK